MADQKYDKKVPDNAKFYTLTATAYAALHDIGAGEERFDNFLKWAFEGYKEFNFDAANEVRAEEIDMKPWKQVDFPCNMVDWNVIGFRYGNQVRAFTQDNNIPKVFDVVNCVPQENQQKDYLGYEQEQYFPFWGYDDAYYLGASHFYGAVLDYNHRGYFDVDWRNRVINFKQTVPEGSKVYIEYITDGINPTGYTVVHPYAHKCLQNYIHWQRKEHDDRKSLGEKQRAEIIYRNSLQEVLVRQLNITIEDIKGALRSGNRQTIKG